MQVISTRTYDPSIQLEGGVFTYSDGNPVFIHEDGTWDFARGKSMNTIFQAALSFQKQSDAGAEKALTERIKKLDQHNQFLFLHNRELLENAKKQELDKQYLDGLWHTAQAEQRLKDAEVEEALRDCVKKLDRDNQLLLQKNTRLLENVHEQESKQQYLDAVWNNALAVQKEKASEMEKALRDRIQRLEAGCRLLVKQNKFFHEEAIKHRRISELGLIPGSGLRIQPDNNDRLDV